MAKYEVFDVEIVPHPDTKGSKGWYIVSGTGRVNREDDGEPWDSDEVQGKAKAIQSARNLARYAVDTKQAEYAVIYMDGGEMQVYTGKGSKAKKRHAGSKARHSRTMGRDTSASRCPHCGDDGVEEVRDPDADDVYMRCQGCGQTWRPKAGGKQRRAGGKARHAPERSRLRPFATYCAGCHKHISGTEHVWKIAGDKYLCNACGSATGGGKRRHGGKWYVGPRIEKGRRLEPFVAARTPTETSHGKKFGYSIGPFRTKGGAAVMARYGANNPNLPNVAAAEKVAKREKAAGTLDKLMAEVDAMIKR